MIKLKKLNVVKLVESEEDAKKFEVLGFTRLDDNSILKDKTSEDKTNDNAEKTSEDETDDKAEEVEEKSEEKAEGESSEVKDEKGKETKTRGKASKKAE